MAVKIIIVGLFFAAPMFTFAQEKGSSYSKSKEKSWDQLTPYEQAVRSSRLRIKGTRKIKISPISNNAGIQTGCVIAYGHFMRPPFGASYVNHKLFINGVQVEPSMVLERETKAAKPVDPKRLEAAQKQIEVSREIRKRYKYEKMKFWKSDERLRAEMCAFAKSKDVVIDAKWDGNALMVSFVEGTGFELFTFDSIKKPKGWKYKSLSEIKKAAEDAKMEYVRNKLTAGDCIVFSASGNLNFKKDPRDAVNEIMRDNLLSKEEKATRLAEKVFLGVYDVAFDVLENYNAEEWLRE